MIDPVIALIVFVGILTGVLVYNILKFSELRTKYKIIKRKYEDNEITNKGLMRELKTLTQDNLKMSMEYAHILTILQQIEKQRNDFAIELGYVTQEELDDMYRKQIEQVQDQKNTAEAEKNIMNQINNILNQRRN